MPNLCCAVIGTQTVGSSQSSSPRLSASPQQQLHAHRHCLSSLVPAGLHLLPSRSLAALSTPHSHIPFEWGSFHEYCVLRFVHVVAAAGVSLLLWAEFTHVRAGPRHVHLAGCAGGHACVFQHVEGCTLPSPECVPCWGLLSVGAAVRLRVSCVLVGHHHLFLSVAYRVFC